MSAGPSSAVANRGGASLRMSVAAIVAVLALAALAAYTLFSGPTKISVPASATHRAAPGKAVPAREPESPRSEGDDGR